MCERVKAGSSSPACVVESFFVKRSIHTRTIPASSLRACSRHSPRERGSTRPCRSKKASRASDRRWSSFVGGSSLMGWQSTGHVGAPWRDMLPRQLTSRPGWDYGHSHHSCLNNLLAPPRVPCAGVAAARRLPFAIAAIWRPTGRPQDSAGRPGPISRSGIGFRHCF